MCYLLPPLFYVPPSVGPFFEGARMFFAFVWGEQRELPDYASVLTEPPSKKKGGVGERGGEFA